MSSSRDWRLEPTVTAPEAARQIGQYDLIEPLGRGGMGVVWKGVHRHLGQIVAIKFLAPEVWAEPQAVSRFYREMRAVGRVAHPNLVRAMDAGEYDGHHVLVMECVEGLTAGELLSKTGPLPIAVACEIVRQASLGLAAIAAAGMVHRDLKPSNLFLTSDGVVKILDLGLARVQVDVEDRELTLSGNLLGTVDYMSPEQSQNPRAVDVRTDLYSLGCTLYALLAGAAPFADLQNSSLEMRLRAHREEIPASIERLRSEVPVALSEIVAKLLAKRPEDRLNSAEELANSLVPFSSAESLLELAQEVSVQAQVGEERVAAGEGRSTSQRVTASEIETSEIPISPDGETPIRLRVGDRPTVVSRQRRVLIGVAVGLLIATLATAGWFQSLEEGAETSADKVRSPATEATNDLAAAGSASTASSPEIEAVVVHDYSSAAQLEWHDLLAHRPVPVFWENGEGLARQEWQEKQSQFVVGNNERGLISLGRLDADDYKLQVGIHQNGWPGGIGLFVGLEGWEPEQSGPGWHCYCLTFQHLPGAKAPRQNRLDFMRLESTAGIDRPVVFRPISMASQIVSRPVGEAILELTVKRGRLNRVLFDGAELTDLVPAVNAIRPEVVWSGGFGVSVDQGDATIRRASIMVIE